MRVNYEIRKKVNDFIELVALGPVKGFYPTAVAKYAGIPLENAYEILLELTESGEISLVWELRCPNIECQTIIEENIKENRKKYDINELNCDKCGFEFTVSESDYHPRFDVNIEYSDFIHKDQAKSSKKKVLSLIP